MNRLLGIVHMNPEIDPSWWDHTEEERYGIGDVRTPEQFYGIFGIDVVNKHTEGELCLFVDTIGRMHKQFTPFLTSNGMSIDYSNIHFQWVAPKNEVAVKESSVDNKRGGEPSSNLFSRS